MKHLTLFCDGSALGNPGAGGYGAILRYGNKEKIIKGGEKYTTNNKMELTAVIEGLKAIKEPCFVTVISDSSYVVKGINEWLDGWIRKKFKNIKNIDLWQQYIQVSHIHKIKAVWVKGHNGHEENERCDIIAKDEAYKQKNMVGKKCIN